MNSALSKYSLLFLAAACVFIMRCTKEKNNLACESLVFSATSTISNPCTGEGTIMVASPTGGNWKYSIGKAAFQACSVFVALLPANYTITAKNEKGCLYESNIEVMTTSSGPLFNQVKSLLATNCISCHSGANPQAGLNWTFNCDIINFWNRIKARAVDGNPSPMPQGGLLPLSERNKVTAWINAGHRFTD